MRRLGALLLVFGLVWPAIARPRAVSLNMCTDQLLLALADSDQILGLSYLARDPALSFHWRRAGAFPTLSGQAEDVLPLKPDLVLTATFVRAPTRDMLRGQGFRIEEFASAHHPEEVIAQLRRAGDLLDQRDRAETAVAAIEAARHRLRRAMAGKPLSVLPLERRGWVSGRDSLITALLADAGLTNLGAGVTETGERLPLERIVTLKPDRLLLSETQGKADDQGLAFLRHPALANAMPAARHLIMPDALTVCGGAMLAEAYDHLARELQRSTSADGQ